MIASHDFEDIINIVEGRSTLVTDIHAASPPLRAYLVRRLAAILVDGDFRNALPGLIAHDELHTRRLTSVIARLSDVAAL